MKNKSCMSINTSMGEIRILRMDRNGVSRIHRILLPEGVQKGGAPPDRTLSADDGQLRDEKDFICLKIREFLSGGAVEFSLKEMDMSICSVFQRKVYMQSRRIPRGRVMSYSQLAKAIGIPEGARAVGMALSRNPFPLVIPCHRIVRATGDLGGFGGGIKLKKCLLEMEGVTFDPKGRVLQGFFTR